MILVTGTGSLAPDVERLATDIEIITTPLGPYRLANMSSLFHRACRNAAERSDLIHTHGMWLFPNWSSAFVARRLGRPLVVSPRGMLLPAARKRSSLRKHLLWALLDGRNLRSAALVHATSEAEAGAIRSACPSVPIAVIPNGVDPDEFPESEVRQVKRAEKKITPQIVFLGRIHPFKGVGSLLEAWAIAKKRHIVAELEIVGVGEPHYVRQVWEKAKGLPDVRMRTERSITAVERLELLAGASVLMLPSHSESYGMVVAEALACETPVITTTGTPWSVLVERRCGWWVDPCPDALAKALIEALSLQPSTRADMGRRGRRVVEEGHSLRAVAAQMMESYLWVCGRCDRPAWVQLG